MSRSPCSGQPFQGRPRWQHLLSPVIAVDSPSPPSGPEAKRRRTDAFMLRNNDDDLAAPNPERFTRHPLRPEQLRSLGWMLAQEARPDGVHGGVRGGVLADKMGSGKTATTIGLISLGQPSAPRDRYRSVEGYIQCEATLVLCPSHLVKQWQCEFQKFLSGRVIGSGFVSEPSSLKVLFIDDHRAHSKASGDNILAADVVLVAYSVQSAPSYFNIYRKDWGITGTAVERTKALRDRVCTWQRESGNDSFEQALKKKRPLFQMFRFHRIVMDEFHEAESWDYRSRAWYEQTAAIHRWGMSGTPPIDNTDGVVDLAEILGYNAGDFRANPSSWRWRPAICRHCPNPTHSAAQRFLDDCVRQNSSDAVDSIRAEEHLVIVVHTVQERLIYQQACRDHGIYDIQVGYDSLTLSARADLLKRCAHFAIGDEVGTADVSVQLLGRAKRQRIKDLEDQLRIEVQRARRFAIPGFEDLLKEQGDKRHDDKFIGSLSAVDQGSTQAFALELDSTGQWYLLAQPIKDSEYLLNPQRRHTLRHAVARAGKHRAADTQLKDTDTCLEACTLEKLTTVMKEGFKKLLSFLMEARKSLRFYELQVRSLSDGACRTCNICLDEHIELSDMCLLPCSHSLHTTCARDWLAKNPFCPECREPVQAREIKSLQLELKPVATERDASMLQPVMTPAWRAHGSKLNRVAEVLRKIRAEDPTAKAIVFVQWRCIEDRVAAALRAHGIDFRQLSVGRGGCDGDVIAGFQTCPQSFVLLLSLQHAASGSNLTAASHVLFVHPMNADTAGTAVAYENQAIGRVRRLGQERNKIDVWRFVTADTVEEHVTSIHRMSSEPPAAMS